MVPICVAEFSNDNHEIESSFSESKIEAEEEEFYECFEEISDTVSHEEVGVFGSENVDDHSVNFDLEKEEEKSKLVFKFQYQNWNCNFSEELKGNLSESSDFDKRGGVSSSVNKYEFISGKSFSKFLDEPKASNFAVKEFFVHPNDNVPLAKNHVADDSAGLLSENSEEVSRIQEVSDKLKNSEQEVVNGKIVDNVSEKLHGVEVSNKLKNSEQEVVDGKIVDNVSEKLHEEEVVEKLKNSEPYARNFLSDDDFICSSSDTDSISSLDDGFLSDTDFGTTTDFDTLGNNEEENVEDLDFKDEESIESLDFGYEPDDFGEEDEDIMNELGKLEEEIRQEESLKQKSKSLTAFDLDESNRFDTLWEHQDLIEQLKMELKKVKATGLPTIFEDSESPRVMEDLKPWKIDEKFQQGSSTTNELPKFYRSYRERMRKFDILNYQKMYALG